MLEERWKQMKSLHCDSCSPGLSAEYCCRGPPVCVLTEIKVSDDRTGKSNHVPGNKSLMPGSVISIPALSGDIAVIGNMRDNDRLIEFYSQGRVD